MKVLITTNGGTQKQQMLEELHPEFDFLAPIIEELKTVPHQRSIYFPHPGGGLREAEAWIDLKFVDYKATGVITFKCQKGELRQAYNVEVKQHPHYEGFKLRYKMGTGVKHNKGLHPSGTEECPSAKAAIESFIKNYLIGAPFRKVVNV